jgi:Leucine-rich repeat (LRR) protein
MISSQDPLMWSDSLLVLQFPQVVELNLADNRILVIPPAIGEMWQLQELKLDHNKVRLLALNPPFFNLMLQLRGT